MPYIIIDNQGTGTHWEDTFESLEDIRQHLADYHSVDWEEEIDINSLSLDELLDYGDWSIDEV